MFLFGLVVAVLLYLSWRPDMTLVTPQKPAAEQGVTLFNSRYEGWEGAKRVWTLEATEIFGRPTGTWLIFAGLRYIRLYQEDDRILSHKCGYGPA